MAKRMPVAIAVPVVIAAVAIGAGAYYFSVHPTNVQKACTTEAKLCSDGSYVGRTGPDCSFAPCPGSPTPTPAPVPGDCRGPGDTSCGAGYTCIQKCGPPVVQEGAPPPGYYCATNDVASKPRMCPICLASNAMIATPWGDVNVKTVQVGDVVWSVDADGKKMAQPVLAVTKTPVSTTHQVVDLKLSDGREVWASPNHPTTDGRTVGVLKVGDTYDGAKVTKADLVPYWDDATYDILPDGDTGEYWANGVLLESTLKQ